MQSASLFLYSAFKLKALSSPLSLSQVAVPEIQRCELASVVLTLLTLNISNVNHFSWLDSPNPAAIQVLQIFLILAIQLSYSWLLTDLTNQLN